MSYTISFASLKCHEEIVRLSVAQLVILQKERYLQKCSEADRFGKRILYFKPNCGRRFFERLANKNETATGKKNDHEKASQGGNGFTLRAGDQWWLIKHQVCVVRGR